MSEPKLPMSGVRVLDAATFLAGPFCASIFSEFGADVIKIEHPEYGDPARAMGTRSEGGETLIWLSEARNKRTMTLNLGTPDGASLFKELVKHADVVVENFRPGTMERWGLGYEQLSAINKKIVMVRVSAYGQDGPYRNRPGFARIAHAFGGLTYLSGESDGRPVVPGSTSLADYISGMYSAIGALMALRDAERSGVGQVVDMALYESVFRMLDETAPVFAAQGIVRERLGADVPHIAPHSHYMCADGRWVALACSSDKMFARLAHLMGRPDLLETEGFRTMAERAGNRESVNAVVSGWIGEMERDALMSLCLEAEVPCGPINSIEDIFEDPHIAARDNLVTVRTGDAEDITVPGVVPKLSRTPGRITHLGRKKGEDTMQILQDLLGLSQQQIDTLRANHTI